MVLDRVKAMPDWIRDGLGSITCQVHTTSKVVLESCRSTLKNMMADDAGGRVRVREWEWAIVGLQLTGVRVSMPIRSKSVERDKVFDNSHRARVRQFSFSTVILLSKSIKRQF